MPHRRMVPQALFLAHPRHPELGGDLVDLPFDRLEADHAVQVGECLLQGRRLGVATEPLGHLGEGELDIDVGDGHQVGRRRS